MSNLEPGQLQRTECGAIDGALESLFGILRTGFALLALAVQHILLTGFADRDVLGANAFVAALDPRQHRRHGCLVVMAGRLLAECMVDLLSGFPIAASCHPAAAFAIDLAVAQEQAPGARCGPIRLGTWRQGLANADLVYFSAHF